MINSLVQRMSDKVDVMYGKVGLSKRERRFFDGVLSFLLTVGMFIGSLWVIFRVYGRLGFEKTLLLMLFVVIFTLNKKL